MFELSSQDAEMAAAAKAHPDVVPQSDSNVPDEAECEELLAWGEIWAGAEWTCLAWCLSTLIWSSLVILSIVDSRF